GWARRVYPTRDKVALIKGGQPARIEDFRNGDLADVVEIAAGRVYEVRLRPPLKPATELQASKDPLNSLSWSGDGKLLATCAYYDGSVILWDAQSKQQVREIKLP